MQKSWVGGETSEDWNCADIAGIRKNDAKSEPNNYKLMSLTSIWLENYGESNKTALFDYTRENKMVSETQYGFLPCRSTILQLLQAFDDWTAELENDDEVDID